MFSKICSHVLISLFVIFSLLQFGCSGGDSVEQIVIYNPDPSEVRPTKSFSEYDFCSNPSSRVKPGDIGAVFLEPSDATVTLLPDTNGPGEDVIPLEILESGQYYYSMDTRDNSILSVKVTDRMGKEVFTLDQNEPDSLVYLSPGTYSALITSGYTESGKSDHRVVFLCPDMGFKSSQGEGNAVEIFKQVFRVNSAPWANLSDINLSHANLDSADLYYVNLKKANMNAASLEKANLEGADLGETVLYAANLREVNLHTANLKKANLHGANLERANLSSTILDEAFLYAANLENVDLAGASLRNANLYASNLKEANLISADLSGANLFSAEMEKVNLIGACLDDAYLYAADLSLGNLEGATLKNSNLAVVCLHKANLHNANLTGANLADADLSYSVLKNAILTGANLEGADLSGADTSGVIW